MAERQETRVEDEQAEPTAVNANDRELSQPELEEVSGGGAVGNPNSLPQTSPGTPPVPLGTGSNNL